MGLSVNHVRHLLTLAWFFAAVAHPAAQTAPLPAARTTDRSHVSFDEVRAAAVRGDAGAQFSLGRALFRGEGVAQDVPAAVEWLERAAGQGVLEAQMMAGAVRERGVGGRIDFGQAVAWYRRAADQGNPGAQLKLGLLHANNRPGGKLDFPAALKLIQVPAKEGYTVARFVAGWLEPLAPPRGGSTNLHQAARWLLAAAMDGVADAQWQLGVRYEMGRGTKPDLVEAAKWYELAARQRHAHAATALAKLAGKLSRFERDEAKRLTAGFVPRPPVPLPVETHELLYYLNPVGKASSAFTSLQAAAAKGDAQAQFQLGLTLLLREDTSHLTAMLGRGWSMSNGTVTSGGKFPAPHELEAAKWLQAAAAQGNPGAQLQLALLFLDPLSRSTNTAEGLRWLQAAANGGVAAAQFQLARFHQEGGLVRKDAAEALRWLRRAAESGYSPAQTNLATLLMDTKLLGVDFGEGVRWLRTVAAGGHPQAQRDLRRIFGSNLKLTVPSPSPSSPVPPAASPPPASLKLAIAATGDAVRPVADLLTASLSQPAGVTLLERAEIDRVWREQSLTALGRSGFVKLGEVLGADGVLLVETNSTTSQTNLSARLVAVKTGVTVGHLTVAFPLADVTEWSGRAAAQFLQWLPKLAVARKDAVPVSILNLRSSLNTTRAVALERDLTLLLTERLLRQREVFVLERRRLDRLTAERELGGDESAFWNGSHLLEGIINKDGEQAGRVTVHGRLIPPGGGAATQVQVEGERAELPQLVNELAGKILASLNRSSLDTAWGTPEEAAKYFEEAKWAWRWGMRPEARAAADAAWALGLRGVELATMRLEEWATELEATAPSRDNVRTSARGYPMAVLPPDPRQLETALQALSFFATYGDPPPDEDPEQVARWLAAGLRGVDNATSVLRHHYQAIEARDDTGESLAELRALARTCYERVAASPLVKNNWLPVRQKTMWKGNEGWTDRSIELFAFRARCGSYWQDQMSESPAFLASIIKHPAYFGTGDSTYQTGTFRDVFLKPMPLTCWSVVERQAAPKAWSDLMDEWCRSASIALHIEGHLRRFQSLPASSVAETRAQGEKLLDLIWNLRTNLMTGAVSPNVWPVVREVVLTKLRQSPGGREVVQEVVSSSRTDTINRPRDDASLLGAFDPRWKQLTEAFRKEQAEFIARRQWEEHKDYLRTAAKYDDAHFTRNYLHRQHSRAEMEELLPLLQAYGERMKWPVWPRQVAERMTRTLNPPTNAVPPRPVVQYVAPRPLPKVASTNTPASPTNVLHAARFWSPPANLFPGKRLYQSGPLRIQFAEGRIWTGLRYGVNSWQGSEFALVALEPDTLSAQTYVLPATEGVLPRLEGTLNPFFPGFVVWGGHVYLHLGDKLRRLKVGGTRWEELPATVPDNATLSVVHGRLYFSATDSILELNEAGDGTRLLASTRRRPAETPLDTLGTLTSPPVFPGPRGTVRVLVGSRLFEHDQHTRAWREAAPPPQKQNFIREANVALATSNASMSRQQWFGLFDDETEWSHFYDTAPPSYGGGTFVGAGSTTGTRWRVHDRIDPYLAPVATPGKDLWSIHGWIVSERVVNAGMRWKPASDRHTTLLFFPAGRSAPYLIPLWLEAANGAGLPQNSAQNTAWMPQTKLIAADDGLIVTDKRVPAGFWVITKADLDPFLREQEQLTVERDRVKQKSEAARLAQLKKTLLADFDTNRNGTFEPEEERAARDNPIYQRLLDQESAAGWLKQFDANGDSLLDAQEYAVLRAKPPEFEGRKWVPPPFAEVVQLDLNRDQRLNVRELEALVRLAAKRPTEAKKP